MNEEQKNIKKYHALDERGKKAVNNLIDEQYEYVKPKSHEQEIS